MIISDLALWIGLSTITGLGLKTRLQLLERIPDFRKWQHLSEKEITEFQIPKSIHALLQRPIQWSSVDKAISWMNHHGGRMLTLVDEDYPIGLKQIADPPWTLFLLGNHERLTQTQLAVVGSRQASISGARYAAQFARYIGEANIGITSGFARGIDRAAHAGALPTQGGTIAVLAHGFEHCYPKQHKEFFSDILAQGGLFISEWLPCVAPRAAFFSYRNRMIAALSRGVLVIEAGLRSGSLITARLAAEYGRDVFALPHALFYELGRGCHRLIRDGAFLIESPEEILENWGWQPTCTSKPIDHPSSPLQKKSLRAASISPQGERVMACFSGGQTMSFDFLIAQSRLTAETLSSILLELEMQGQIESVVGGYRQIEAMPLVLENENAESLHRRRSNP